MEKIIYSLLIFSGLFLNACSEDTQPTQVTSEKKAPENHTIRLELAWETRGFNNPESVIYDASSDILFVSNVNGSPVEKDGNGYISKILLDGTMLKKQWVVGLNAPKGLAIHEGTLYVSDIDTLVAIDIASGTINNSYQVDDAKFLNDVSVNKDGKVFVTDMVLNRIHCLCDDQFNIWLESPKLENPNGLHVEGDNLILGAWGVMTDDFATDGTGSDIESYLQFNADKFCRDFDANCYIKLSQTMNWFSLMEEINSPLDEFAASKLESALVVGISTDILFPPHQQRELADLLNKSGIETTHHEIDCPHGHDAFLIDEENFIPLISTFLDSLN